MLVDAELQNHESRSICYVSGNYLSAFAWAIARGLAGLTDRMVTRKEG